MPTLSEFHNQDAEPQQDQLRALCSELESLLDHAQMAAVLDFIQRYCFTPTEIYSRLLATLNVCREQGGEFALSILTTLSRRFWRM